MALEAERLEQLALAYVARFATSAARLDTYLAGKVRRAGWQAAGQGEPLAGEAALAAAQEVIAALVARAVAAGYVDDAGFARARSASLLRRGYGARRVDQALDAAGIDEEIRAGLRPDESAARAAALAFARRRGLGPFTREGQKEDPRRREKQIAALLRAGHGFGVARALVDSPDVAAAQGWAAGDGAADEGDGPADDGPAADLWE